MDQPSNPTAIRARARPSTARIRDAGRRWDWPGYLAALAATVLCTLIGFAMQGRFELVNIAMVYLLAVVGVALRYARGPAVATSVLCVLAFDLLFVPPRFHIGVEDAQYLLTFAILLTVGLVVSSLVAAIRARAAAHAALEIDTQTERIRSTLLASISHDLRTPLAVMSGASSTLAENGERLDPAQREALARSIYQNARDMTELLSNVLQMARLESGAMQLERDWAALPEIVGTVLGRLQQRLEAHRLMLDLPDDLPLIRVNAPLIEQVLANLLENAAKYTPAGTVVRVRAQRDAAQLTIAVEDFGPGLPEAVDLEALFAKFQRGAREGATGGMGLGLAICRAIVKLHGGRMWAQRVPGAGTAFCFTLPLEAVPAMPVEIEPVRGEFAGAHAAGAPGADATASDLHGTPR